MILNPINPYTNYTQTNIKQRPIFRAQTVPKVVEGKLKLETQRLADDILRGYREIRTTLAGKTDEGIDFIKKKYPNVSIGEALIFHNCGKDKSSIVMKIGEMGSNRNLTYIGRREGNTWQQKYNLLEAFMLEGYSRLLKDFEQSYYNHFPKERNYISQSELDTTCTEEDLTKLLSDLDLAMVLYRKFLSTCQNEYLKAPDGIISYNTISSVKETFNLIQSITEKSKKFSTLMLRRVNNDFKDVSLSKDGTGTFIFNNIGDENLTIKLRQVLRSDENLKKLAVFDKDGHPIKVFLIKNDEKFIKNHYNKECIPDSYSYFNSEELEKDVLPEFKKYYQLYATKLKEYDSYIDSSLEKYLNVEEVGFFPDWIRGMLNEIDETFAMAKASLKKLSQEVVAEVKTRVTGIKYDGGKRGLWLKGYEGDKVVHFLPLNSVIHENLSRLTIYDENMNEEAIYLLKDNKHIVKNFNPKYPTMIPKELAYASENDMNSAQIAHCARFIIKKLDELVIEADKAYKKRNIVVKKTKKDVSLRTKKIREVSKECKKQFARALKYFDKDIMEFNRVMDEIKEKVNKVYKQ